MFSGDALTRGINQRCFGETTDLKIKRRDFISVKNPLRGPSVDGKVAGDGKKVDFGIGGVRKGTVSIRSGCIAWINKT